MNASAEAVVPAPVPAPPAPIVLQPGVATTLQVTVNGVTIKATITINVSASGGVSFTVDSKAMTADTTDPV